MICLKKIIDYIDQNITDYNDYVYLNIDYMKRAIKSVYIKENKLIFESNFTPQYKFLSAEKLLDQLYNIKNIDLPIWLKISNMFKPLNFIHMKKNKINLYYDFDPQIDIDPIIDINNIDENNDINEDNDIDKENNDINDSDNNADENIENIGSDNFD